jgi:hypothetical protein
MRFPFLIHGRVQRLVAHHAKRTVPRERTIQQEKAPPGASPSGGTLPFTASKAPNVLAHRLREA